MLSMTNPKCFKKFLRLSIDEQQAIAMISTHEDCDSLITHCVCESTLITMKSLARG